MSESADTFNVTVVREFKDGWGKLHRRGETLTLPAGDVKVLLALGKVRFVGALDSERLDRKLHTPEVTDVLQRR